MRRKLGLALCMILGSLLLYCGDSVVHGVMQGMDGGGGGDASSMFDVGAILDALTSPRDAFVKDAKAQQACCTGSQTFTKLAEGDLSTSQSSPIAVGPYRQVVVYLTSFKCMNQVSNGYAGDVHALFRADSSSPFGGTGSFFNVGTGGGTPDGARINVDGSDMVLSPEIDLGTCQGGGTVHYVVSGITTM